MNILFRKRAGVECYLKSGSGMLISLCLILPFFIFSREIRGNLIEKNY